MRMTWIMQKPYSRLDSGDRLVPEYYFKPVIPDAFYSHIVQMR
jgi:hypothetical protein